MVRVRAGDRPANVLRRWWRRLAGREAGVLEQVATLRHSVLNRRYEISLFTFKEDPLSPSPKLRGQLETLRQNRIFLLRTADLSRHAHGGLLLKVLAAWRAHRARGRRRTRV
jgi:hypothetical protein